MLRRRMMMQSGCGKGYIKKGLVLWLDAEDFDGGATWMDRIGGVVFQNHGATKNEGVFFDGKSYMVGEPLDIIYYNYTLEVVVKNDSNYIQPFVFFPNITGKDTLAFALSKLGSVYGWKDFEGIITKGGQKPDKCGWIYNDLTKKMSASVNSKMVVLNYEKLTNYGNIQNFSSTKSATYIGARYEGAQQLTGNIYCIRAYNRQLEYLEMLHNQQIDNERFKLGL